MKQLKFDISLSQYNEKHTIYLGNKESLEHKSKSFLKLYLRTYKKVILDNVRNLNSHNSHIYSLYRTFFFDLSDIEVDRVCQMFQSFNKSFNWMFDNIGGCQNSIIFSKINLCISCNIDILNLLKNHSQIHKNYSLKNQAESYLKMMIDFQSRFESDKRSLDLNRDYTKNNLKLIKKQLEETA